MINITNIMMVAARSCMYDINQITFQMKFQTNLTCCGVKFAFTTR